MDDLETRFENAVCEELAVVQNGDSQHRDLVDFIWDGGMVVVSADGENISWQHPDCAPSHTGPFGAVVRYVADRYRDSKGA